MEARIPPDIVLLCSAILMWLLSKCLPAFGFVLPHHTIVFGIILLVGLALIFFAKVSLYNNHTTERPGIRRLPRATVLVTGGIYNFSRNPIYLGMIVLLLGWEMMLMNWFSLIGVLCFISFITRFQIIPEEKMLEHVFGDEYRLYKRQVRRWL